MYNIEFIIFIIFKMSTPLQYEQFYTGPNDTKHHGVGIIMRKDMKADYKETREKICVATIKLEK